MEKVPHISSELQSEKIKIVKNINLNSLFNLSYNFEVLKLLIENLIFYRKLLKFLLPYFDFHLFLLFLLHFSYLYYHHYALHHLLISKLSLLYKN